MKVSLIAIALLVAVALVACGGNDDNSASSSSTPATVSMQDGLLVDSNDAPLYSSDQEKSGKVVCTDGCTAIWLPLKAPASGQPTGDGVSGTLGTVKRPDGERQVTLDGRPLYRFSEDGAGGKATGDGVTDSFGGRQFTWQAEGTGASGGSMGGSYSY